eukprot:CAMPEP_0114507262 /NCGR_PEP_ID=MMETSP0109-20121206/11910_1 /TAXON_ID=29199 /ORGANISM="Chlorarachnion reptans, Strain CCCM449" /LENGTH=85 /DNA_ID=CAMNT_0001685991 /DNA_START=109 /DNA_END=363 /DNA_ORIENTATION=+
MSDAKSSVSQSHTVPNDHRDGQCGTKVLIVGNSSNVPSKIPGEVLINCDPGPFTGKSTPVPTIITVDGKTKMYLAFCYTNPFVLS